MTHKKSDRLGPATTVGTIAFIILCYFSIQNSQLLILHSNQSIERIRSKPAMYAPDNLASAAESLQVSIPVEAPDFPVEKMVRLKAWKELQDKLLGYSKYLKLLEAQDLELNRRFQRQMLRSSYISLAWIIGILVLTLLYRKQQNDDRRAGGVEKEDFGKKEENTQ
jgi:hypothetical protein